MTDNGLLKPVSRDTLTRRAAETIKRFILEENLPAGAQLPSERDLSETLAVSRTIIREALSSLASQNIVEKYVGRGTFVGDFDRSQVGFSVPLTLGENGVSMQAMREARAAMELGAVGLIVRRISDDEIAELSRLIDVHERKHHEGKSTIKEDIEFHLTLLKATKNEVFTGMTPLVEEVFRDTLVQGPSAIRNNPERIIREHRAILEAVRRRDTTALREALHTHFRLQDIPV